MRHFIFLVFAAASAIGWAQNQPQTATPAPQPSAAALPTYEPSELQKLKLENAQLKLVVIACKFNRWSRRGRNSWRRFQNYARQW